MNTPNEPTIYIQTPGYVGPNGLHTIPGSQGFEIWAVYPYNRRETLVTLSPSMSLFLARKIANLVALDHQLGEYQED
jgi:hypothetical protein